MRLASRCSLTSAARGLTTCGWGATFSRNGFTYRWGEPFRRWNEETDEVLRNKLGSSLPECRLWLRLEPALQGAVDLPGLPRPDRRQGLQRNQNVVLLAATVTVTSIRPASPNGRKKTIEYYRRALAQADAGFVDLFLEDGSYLKLGEARVSYRARRGADSPRSWAALRRTRSRSA